MFKLPFGWLPGHWGLKGKSRELAKIEYEHTGYNREERILYLNADLYSSEDFKKRLWDLQLKHGKIDKSEFNRKLLELISDDTQRALAEAELDHRDGKIGDVEYEKKVATIKGEPWVNVLKMDFTKGTALEGSFELDWNEHFVEKLKAEGYNAPSPDLIVNQWFMEICRNVAMEEFGETGDFAANSEANLETFKRWSAHSEPIEKGKKGYR